MSNRKAIVVYVDDTPRCLEEYTWLYKSWRFHNIDEDFDIVVFCNPSAESKIEKHKNIIIKPLEPVNGKGGAFNDYGFANSFAMFNDQETCDWMSSKYDYILKSDCDVFLTENIKGFTPSKVMIGEGGYMTSRDHADDIIKRLKHHSDRLKLQYNNLNHIGASIFGPTSHVLTVVRWHFKITEYMLKVGWANGEPDVWPGWFKGVASMYAIHIVINNFYTQQGVSLYGLDSKCWINDINSDTYHIHAWHTTQYWSKNAHFKGEYDKYVTETIPTKANEYCHWIATNTLEEMLSIKP